MPRPVSRGNLRPSSAEDDKTQNGVRDFGGWGFREQRTVVERDGIRDLVLDKQIMPRGNKAVTLSVGEW